MEPWRVARPLPLPGRGRALRTWDTAAREIRPVAPGPTATMYVCGITPYDATHLGHAMTYLTGDLAHRVLLDGGHRVHYVQNVTDVDEPLFERAAETGEDWRALGTREVEQFRSDMAALNVLPPDDFVGAVEAVPLIVELIARLRTAGMTYDVERDVYLSLGTHRHFGELSGLDAETMVQRFGANGGDPGRAGKKDPLDPVLWVAERPGEPSWEAPWGKGRPGWHVECAAIAMSRFGPTMDLHGGGTDLVFPHHEMCAATAALATGEWPFARSWLHTGMVGLHGEKMSKSKGNLVFVRHLRLSHDAAAVRLALLDHHYREPWEWYDADLVSANERLASWRAAAARDTGPPAETVLEGVRTALADDLDSPAALRVIDAWAAEAAAAGDGDRAAPALVRQTCDTLLGVQL